MLPDEPAELVRKDKNFKELDLRPEDYTTREAVVSLLLEHPKLMQRSPLIQCDYLILSQDMKPVMTAIDVQTGLAMAPLILRGEKAVIARPSDKVLELL